MWFHGKGLTFIECGIAGIIVLIFLAVVLPAVSQQQTDVRRDCFDISIDQLRGQVDAYRHDHAGVLPSGEKFESQMTLRTNAAGDVCPADGDPKNYPFGPYVKRIPVNPYAAPRIGNRVTTANSDEIAGWIYNPHTGQVAPILADEQPQ
ncbi:MAG: hypothetical protein KAR11_01405 [Phycisphaerae bacterium]|nr:hypothetical protein [Phycisphaerae bacterium]